MLSRYRDWKLGVAIHIYFKTSGTMTEMIVMKINWQLSVKNATLPVIYLYITNGKTPDFENFS